MILCILLTGALSARAELPPGKPIAPADLAKFHFGASPQLATSGIVPVEGQSFATARHIDVAAMATHPWDVNLNASITGAVAKDDVLLLTLWLRGLASRAESGEVAMNACFEKSGEPYTKSLEMNLGAGKEWKKFQLPFKSLESYEAGAAHLTLHCGKGIQTLEIGGIELVNYGKTVKFSDLPRTKISYKGREPDAPWRKEALARIEQIRKGDLTIQVVDSAGKPAAGVEVRAKLTHGAFGFGSAVAAQGLLSPGADNDAYREHIQKLFNRVVLENDLKWQGFEGSRQRAIDAVEWARARNIDVRGHNLVWPNWRYLPRDMQNLKADPAALRKRINDHILDEAATFKGKLIEWDVINEPYTNKDLQKILGDEEMIQWFKLARQADPTARLFLNDYPILRGDSEPHMDGFEKALRFLVEGGAPINGIGVQCHYGAIPPPPAQLLAGLDRLAKFKLPIAVTELDFDTDDEELHADFLRDHLIAFFGHPSVDSILMWGFWEGRHWKPKAAIYRRDWSIKPAGKVFEDLVLKEWRTDVTVKTDEKGMAIVRGFLGEYELTGGAKPEKATLGRDGAAVKLVR